MYRAARISTLLALVFILLAACQAVSQPVVDEHYCAYEGKPPALRQTLVLIDGSLVIAEPAGPVVENQGWRKFVMQFLNNSDPLIRQRVDARERVTVAVANADGSGLTMLFSGCVPLFRSDEELELDGKTSMFERFLGSDWRRAFEEAGTKFSRAATAALITGVRGLPVSGPEPIPFSAGPVARSLTTSLGYSLEKGVPRIIVYTNLAQYQFPTGDPQAIRAAARADGEALGIDLMRAEVHVFGAAGTQGDAATNYLEAFFLTNKGFLATIAASNGSMTASSPPRSVSMYQGTIDYPDARYPLRMRLALDQNGTVVNSWIEVQSGLAKFVPFFGIMNCGNGEVCEYVGDNIFSQVWDDNPDPEPDLQVWQPFGGMRTLAFVQRDEVIEGVIKDDKGYVVGREDGLAFSLTRVPGGLF